VVRFRGIVKVTSADGELEARAPQHHPRHLEDVVLVVQRHRGAFG